MRSSKYIPILYGKYLNVLAAISEKAAAEKAFTLFCTPRKGGVKPQQVEYLKQAENTVELVRLLRKVPISQNESILDEIFTFLRSDDACVSGD